MPSQTVTDLSQLTGSWTLNPAQASVEFETRAMWILKVKGTARAARGSAVVESDGSFRGELAIDASTIDTKNKKRDAHLQTADFFEVTTHPTINFAATGGHASADGKFEVSGTLTSHGQATPLNLVVEVTAEDSAAIVSTEVELDRTALGVSWTKMGAGTKNRIMIRAHFTRD
jgi:polyisoprenoid-binding protein YceI